MDIWLNPTVNVIFALQFTSVMDIEKPLIADLELPRRLLRSHSWKIIIGLIAVILTYTAIFQFFYVWMRYGVINAYGNVQVLMNTYMMNLVPLSVLWVIISALVFLPKYRCNMALRCVITFVLSVISVGLTNLIFILITHQYVEWGGTFFNCILIYLICEVVYYECVRRDAESQRRAALQELMDYRQRVMLAQFKPHFLFNSLNILYSMLGSAGIEENRKFILVLSEIYRYILDNREIQEISLEKELAFLNDYLHILNLRYGSKFKVSFVAQPPAGKFVVPFSMQLLVENVVKHNRLTSAEPLEVEIRFMSDRVIVTNPLRVNLNKKDKSGYGLSYLKRIYEKYRLKISVNSDDKVFSVEVPYITLTKNRIYHDQISNC